MIAEPAPVRVLDVVGDDCSSFDPLGIAGQLLGEVQHDRFESDKSPFDVGIIHFNFPAGFDNRRIARGEDAGNVLPASLTRDPVNPAFHAKWAQLLANRLRAKVVA